MNESQEYSRLDSTSIGGTESIWMAGRIGGIRRDGHDMRTERDAFDECRRGKQNEVVGFFGCLASETRVSISEFWSASECVLHPRV